jgi:hypothetical protein
LVVFSLGDAFVLSFAPGYVLGHCPTADNPRGQRVNM